MADPIQKELTHLDQQGNPGMVDVTEKATTQRQASASGQIMLGRSVMQQLVKTDFSTKKGSIIQTSVIAATMAVKNTYNAIPLCHQIPITSCKIKIDTTDSSFDIQCTVRTSGQTGVEMEALHGVSVAALTIYDMCKALSHEMVIQNIQLETKSGGKNDYKR